MRLTYNYARKGGYERGSEDYRWEILRKYIPGPLFFVFNVLFISLAQSVSVLQLFSLLGGVGNNAVKKMSNLVFQVLLWGVTTPTYMLLLVAPIAHPWTPGDMMFQRAMFVLNVIIWLGDQQQWSTSFPNHLQSQSHLIISYRLPERQEDL